MLHDGMGIGREVQEGEHVCILVADSRGCQQNPTPHCQAMILQLKINF